MRSSPTCSAPRRQGFDAVFVTGRNPCRRTFSCRISRHNMALATGHRWRSSTPFAKGTRMQFIRPQDRARPALFLIAGPVRHRKRGAAAAHGRAAEGDHRQARHPVLLQVELRQGQPLVGHELPRAGHGRGAEDPRQGARRARRTGADRCPRHPADQAGSGGRRRAADAGLPRPPDRFHPRRRRVRQAGQHQEGASSWRRTT